MIEDTTTFFPTDVDPAKIEADALVVGLYEDAPLEGAGHDLDGALQGLIARLREAGELSTTLGDVTPLLGHSAVRAPCVQVVGLGSRDRMDSRAAFRAAASAARRVASRHREHVAFYLELPEPLQESAICGALIGFHGQDLYRAERKCVAPDRVSWSGASDETLTAAVSIGRAMNLTRDLVNGPPSEIYPQSFVDACDSVCRETGMQLEVWDNRRLEQEGCGALLAVARGSSRPPRLAIIRYQGAATGPCLGLVGKGVTFDSGGLSIKPTDGMKTMKCDMAGAATVLGAMQAIAELRLPIRVVGYCGLVENMISGDSYKLGDVLRARSGKTIEVLNTDAEGRLVLADVLHVACEQGCDKLVDLATLTGACVVALGTDTAGVMTNNAAWGDAVLSAAAACGERAWQLPMFEEFGEQIRSQVADIKNVGEGRWGGAITAAKFLEEFVDNLPWTHIDIAGPAFLESKKPWSDGGATGAFVRTLVELARRWG